MKEIIINSVNDLMSTNDVDSEGTYVKISIENNDIAVKYSYDGCDPLLVKTMINTIASRESIPEMALGFASKILDMSEQKAEEFLSYFNNEEEDGRKKEIAWTHIDIDEMLADEMNGIISEMMSNDDEEEEEEDSGTEGYSPSSRVKIIRSKTNEVLTREQRMGNTNFDITPYARMISQCDGVDEFVMLGRYRFFIVIGKLFSFKDTRKSIENCINN